MNTEQQNTFDKISGILNMKSPAVLALYPPAVLYEKVRKLKNNNVSRDAFNALCSAGEKQYDDLRILEKKILTRASPLLPKAIRLGLKHPDISLQEYEEWFGGRASHYVSPGAVSSMFSPAAYLSELYRAACKLYPEESVNHIDQRRPDLAKLALSQNNMDTPVSALTLSNKILMERVRAAIQENDDAVVAEVETDDDVLETLAEHVTSNGTPYHHHHNRLRQIQRQKDPSFSQLLSASQVLKHLSGPSLAGIYYDIPPALYQLLIDEITDENAEEKYQTYFGHVPPEELLSPKKLRQWFGLTDDELRAFLGNFTGDPEYVDGVLTTLVDGRILRLTQIGKGSSGPDYIRYINIYPQSMTTFNWRSRVDLWLNDAKTRLEIYLDFDEPSKQVIHGPMERDSTIRKAFTLSEGKSFRDIDGTFTAHFDRYNAKGSKATSPSVIYKLEMLSGHLFLLKLNKAVRLYKATGLSPRQLEDIVGSVDPRQITDETLTLLFRASLLMKRYGISHEDAIMLSSGHIGLLPHGTEASYWNRLFNTPPLVDGSINIGMPGFVVEPDKAGEEAHIGAKAALKRAFCTDDLGLWQLRMIYHSQASEYTAIKFDIKHISDLYALSLWARLHALTPGELQMLLLLLGLPQNLSIQESVVWNTLLDRVYTTVQWLKAQGWTVYDLYLMTSDVTALSAGAEINGLLTEMHSLAHSGSQLHQSRTQSLKNKNRDIIQQLVPLMSAAFSLQSDTAAAALLTWADRAKPGGGTLVTIWADLLSADTPENVLPATVHFVAGLAQMALIIHGTGIPADSLAQFVTNPDALGRNLHEEGTTPTLKRNVEVVRMLADFSQWLKTLPGTQDATALNKELGQQSVTPSRLAQAAGLSEVVVKQGIAGAHEYDDVGSNDSLVSWQEISTVLQWTTLADVFGVLPGNISALLKLDYKVSPVAEWSSWRFVADAFSAGASPTQVAAVQSATQLPLSKALAGRLLNDRSIQCNSIEALNQYLLLDSLNGPQVVTSHIAEALAALQAFIHRTLADVEPGVQEKELGQQFLLDWNQWNARYATWAASQQLMYYPENYIDPTVRLGQTKDMDDMLQVLGQAQINTDTVGDAFLGYLTAFEEVANLYTISGYHDNLSPEVGKTWFVGRNRMAPHDYWWRRVDESKRNTDNGLLPANAWTGWTKISCTPQPLGDLIRPVVYRGRLYLAWIERQEVLIKRDDTDENKNKYESRWELKLSHLRYDGGWGVPLTYAFDKSSTIELEELLEEGLINTSFYLSVWPQYQRILAAVYKKGSEIKVEDIKAEVTIYEDMTLESSSLISKSFATMKGFLDEGEERKVCLPFAPAVPLAEQALREKPRAMPPGFTKFDVSNISAAVEKFYAEKNEYGIRFSCTLHVDVSRLRIPLWGLSQLIDKYPELKQVSDPVTVLYGSDDDGRIGRGVFLVIQPYAYICFRENSHNHTEIHTGDDARAPVESGGTSTEPFYYAKIPATSSYPSPLHRGVTFHTPGALPYTVLSNFMFGYDSTHNNKIIPEEYVGEVTIPGSEVTLLVDGHPTKKARFDQGDKVFTLGVSPQMATWSRAFFPRHGERFTFPASVTEVFHDVVLTFGNGNQHAWQLRVYKNESQLKLDVIGEQLSDTGAAQYLERPRENNTWRTRLNTLFARELTEFASSGIDTILRYQTQELAEPPLYPVDGALQESSAELMMDFNGANAIYFWELFYYTPMMVMQRFLQEERFDLAEHWLKYIFSPSGYIVHGEHVERMWNVRPLAEDISWNDEPLQTWDPDAVAQNDPMHYKVNAFMRLLDITIGRGDAAYRKLERDTLAEAKVWYQRAQRLLGEAPWTATDSAWGDPTLEEVSSEQALRQHIESLARMASGEHTEESLTSAPAIKRTDTNINQFLPEVNQVMLGYWDKLRLRLYNLRNNLTIDGQPLNLPLFATPADPKALLAAAVAAESGAGSGLPEITDIPALRFIPLLEGARTMASQLIQFGSSMQQILERQDAEALAELLNIQGAEIADSTVMLQKQTLNELTAERTTLEKSLESATVRRDHYQTLYNQNMNAGELRAMNKLQDGQNTVARARAAMIAGAALNMAPNLFGLANGGFEWGAVAEATAIGFTIDGEVTISAATRLAQEEQYRRRREEWKIQRNTAEKEMEMIQAQLDALAVRETSAQMQVAHTEQQAAQAKAQLALLQGKFTGKSMYSWLRGRLATIFYSWYDLTASRCLMAQKALQWETKENTTWVKTGTWNGAWAGLMSGEGLMLTLGQMEHAWVKWQKRELEVTRTVSLAAFFSDKLGDAVSGLPDAINKLVNKDGTEYGSGNNKAVLNNDRLAIHFLPADLAVAADFAAHNYIRVRSIAVTLPALLGPYQGIKARLRTDETGLPTGCNECVISHAMQDKGLFSPDGGDSHPRWGSQWLPFEGLNVNSDKGMTLSFEEATGDQKSLLESLNDVILHIQFTVR